MRAVLQINTGEEKKENIVVKTSRAVAKKVQRFCWFFDEEFHIKYDIIDQFLWRQREEKRNIFICEEEGTYHIVLRYFLAAREGNGARFHIMPDTFTSAAS